MNPRCVTFLILLLSVFTTRAADAQGSAETPAQDGQQRDDDAKAMSEPGAWTRADGTWLGPRLEAGYEYFYLEDGHDSGATHTVFFGGFLPIVPELRLGLSVQGGVRDYAFGDNDLYVGGRLLVGYQHLTLDPVVPYVAGTLTGGALVGERFSSSVIQGLIGAGIEAGVDIRFIRSFYGGLGLGYTRADLDGLAHDLFIFRIKVGL